MEAQQIELVQRSFAHASRIGPHVAATFYSELYAIDPSLKAMFTTDMIVQGEKLMTMLEQVVMGLSDLKTLVPTAQELAVRHVSYGVEAKHYRMVGTALLRTLKHELGPAFTPETKAAWTVAYQILSDVMCEAAYGPAASRSI